MAADRVRDRRVWSEVLVRAIPIFFRLPLDSVAIDAKIGSVRFIRFLAGAIWIGPVWSCDQSTWIQSNAKHSEGRDERQVTLAAFDRCEVYHTNYDFLPYSPGAKEQVRAMRGLMPAGMPSRVLWGAVAIGGGRSRPEWRA